MDLKDRLGIENVNEEAFRLAIESMCESFEILPSVRKELQNYLDTGKEEFSTITIDFLGKATNWLKRLYVAKCIKLGIEIPDFENKKVNKLFNLGD